jgi:hypothetical protein
MKENNEEPAPKGTLNALGTFILDPSENPTFSFSDPEGKGYEDLLRKTRSSWV